MKKNRTGTYFPLRKSRVKILMVMKLTFLLVLGFVFSLSASVRAQDQIVTLKVKKTPFSKVISELKQQTSLDFFYSFNEVNVNQLISLDVKNMKIDANGTEIRIMGDIVNEDAYISLTDIAKYKNPDNAFIVVANWMRNHSTISFLGLWEQIHNPNFKPIEFDRFKAESGDNAFTLTPQQWIKATDAIGIISKSGRYGGTYAHTDIAFEFASWISPEFKLYIIKDYQRLKKDEADRLAIGWDVKRELSKINYRIHTDAVKEFLITPTLSQQEMAYTYASEADILNMALFGKTASQWRSEKGIKGKNSNIRDFASAEELVVLINLEDTNADLIRREVPKIERLKILREKAYRQLELLKKNQDTIEALKKNLIEDTETNS